MPRSAVILTCLVACAALVFAACGGDDDDNGGSPTAAASSPSASGTPSSDGGGTATEADAQALLDEALLKPADLDGVWTIQSDTPQDNAAFAAANPAQAPLVEQCDRLYGRTITNLPEDPLNAFLGGTTLAFFSTAQVYATEEGAIECAAEGQQRFAQPGELARAFGVFIDPDAVLFTPFDYPQIADGSIAGTLIGQIDVMGTVIDLTILFVSFRSENVSAVVGSARSGATPPAQELTPYVDLVLERVQANQ